MVGMLASVQTTGVVPRCCELGVLVNMNMNIRGVAAPPINFFESQKSGCLLLPLDSTKVQAGVQGFSLSEAGLTHTPGWDTREDFGRTDYPPGSRGSGATS